jgi:hypothetical protein
MIVGERYCAQKRQIIYYLFVIAVINASLAQLVERGTSNAEVTGSTPLGGSDFFAFFAVCQTIRRRGAYLMVWMRSFCWWLSGGRWMFGRESVFGDSLKPGCTGLCAETSRA